MRNITGTYSHQTPREYPLDLVAKKFRTLRRLSLPPSTNVSQSASASRCIRPEGHGRPWRTCH